MPSHKQNSKKPPAGPPIRTASQSRYHTPENTHEYRPKEISITGLTTPNGDLLRHMFAQGIKSVRPMFSARRICLKRDGDLVDLGPDYMKRIAGLDLLLNLCTRG